MQQWEYLQLCSSVENGGWVSIGPKEVFHDVDWLRAWLQNKCPKATVREASPDKDYPESLVPHGSVVAAGLEGGIRPVTRGIIAYLGSQGWEMVNLAVAVTRPMTPLPPEQEFWFKRSVAKKDG